MPISGRFGSGNPEDGELLHAQAEVDEAINTINTRCGIQVHSLVGNRATKGLALRGMYGAEWVHVAAHVEEQLLLLAMDENDCDVKDCVDRCDEQCGLKPCHDKCDLKHGHQNRDTMCDLEQPLDKRGGRHDSKHCHQDCHEKHDLKYCHETHDLKHSDEKCILNRDLKDCHQNGDLKDSVDKCDGKRDFKHSHEDCHEKSDLKQLCDSYDKNCDFKDSVGENDKDERYCNSHSNSDSDINNNSSSYTSNGITNRNNKGSYSIDTGGDKRIRERCPEVALQHKGEISNSTGKKGFRVGIDNSDGIGEICQNKTQKQNTTIQAITTGKNMPSHCRCVTQESSSTHIDKKLRRRDSIAAQQNIADVTHVGDDGVLSSKELVSKLRLAPGSTVILSACNVARDAAAMFELSRAFMSIGASAVLISMWSLMDESTCALMRRVYRHLGTGKALADALRCAMLQLAGRQFGDEIDPWDNPSTPLSMLPYSRPLHWSGLIVVGAPTYLPGMAPRESGMY
jgi:hypothetical protein